MRPRWWVGEVIETVRETPRTVSLRMTVPGWQGHRPGQHVDVRLTAEDGYQAIRSYSIATPPEDPLVAITVEELDDGEVSPYLAEEVRPGDQLEFLGPIGGYFVWDAGMGGPLLLVAGGSGVVPLMSMLRHRHQTGSSVPARLLYSARTLDDLIYRNELERLERDDPNLTVSVTLTREQPPGWSGFSRRVDAAMIDAVAFPPEARPLAYVCGPTAFVESTAALLQAAGYKADRIRTERFGPTGR